MLSIEQNERLSRVGQGTPMGNLLRRYWYPVAAGVELDENPVKKVRLMGEDLVLYRDKSGNLGLIDEPCPHRRVSLEYGIPEEVGLRCPYHGWVFNHEGRCLEQPAEPWDSTFKDRVTTKAYQVEELGGLVFAYLGPAPAPLLPRYDLLVWDNAVRHVGVTMLPCNWLQAMENSLDPTHVEWLHGYYMDYVWRRKDPNYPVSLARAKHKKIGFDRFEHGMIKRRVVEGQTEEDHPWKVGHPVIFPNILRVGSSGTYNFQYRVPVDDTHTWQVTYTAYRPGVPVPPQDTVPLYEIPLFDAEGKYMTEVTLVQDFFAWVSQGDIARRELEHLGQADIGIIMFRDLLKEQVDLVERGGEPMEVYRDAAKNQCVELPTEEMQVRVGDRTGWNRAKFLEFGSSHERFSPLQRTLVELFQEADQRASRGEALLPGVEPPVYLPGGPGHKQLVILP